MKYKNERLNEIIDFTALTKQQWDEFVSGVLGEEPIPPMPLCWQKNYIWTGSDEDEWLFTRQIWAESGVIPF